MVGTFMRMGKRRNRAGHGHQGRSRHDVSVQDRLSSPGIVVMTLLELAPYARLTGIECTRLGDELLFRLPANQDNIGNPILPALHGG